MQVPMVLSLAQFETLLHAFSVMPNQHVLDATMHSGYWLA